MRRLVLAVTVVAFVSACRAKPAPPAVSGESLVTLSTIVWEPDADHAPDPGVIGNVATLMVSVTETGAIDTCVLTRSSARSYRCDSGLPPIPVTPAGPDNIVTVGWASGETGYGVVINGFRVNRVSTRFDGLSQGHFRVVDASGRIQ